MKQLWLTTLAAGVLVIVSSACASPNAELPKQHPPVFVKTVQFKLQTYDDTAHGIPVIAQYFADTMNVSASASSEGVGVFFTFKLRGNPLDDAQIHIFLPAGVATAAAQERFVTGSRGLIESNAWTVNRIQAGGSAEFPYPWVEKVIDISTDRDESGHILLGQTNGQALQVTLIYPTQLSEAYWASAKTVLDTLEFAPDLMPLRRSTAAE